MKQLFVIIAFVFAYSANIEAQTLEQVLNKYYKAAGLEKMTDVKTFDIKAKVSMMGMEIPMAIKVKRPNKFRVETEMMGQKTISAYDGEKGWMVNPMAGPGVKDLEGAQLKQAMSQADMEGELYNYKDKGLTAELVGKVNSDGKAAYKIKVTDKDGQTKDYFIDAETNLVTKVKASVEAMGQTMDIETKITEYQEIDDMKMAKKMEIVMPMGTQTIVMEEIKVNENMDDSIFSRPQE